MTNKHQGFPLTRKKRQMEECAEFLAALLVFSSVLTIAGLTLLAVYLLQL